MFTPGRAPVSSARWPHPRAIRSQAVRSSSEESSSSNAATRIGSCRSPTTGVDFAWPSETMELWQQRHDRLHDRLRYRRADGSWLIERLAP